MRASREGEWWVNGTVEDELVTVGLVEEGGAVVEAAMLKRIGRP